MPVYLCLLFALYLRCFFFLVFLSSILVGGFSVMFFSNFLFKKKLLLFLAVLGLSCNTRDLSLQHMGSSPVAVLRLSCPVT